ncbi:ceramidase [Truncatella angustata]|uniref:Ceramidase n=1 Tax=Truncatella angustata TaxID=152316 RepID=A0A9P8RGB1_9PEZI|nr:ceramidase [Truncatella angustata]KAH6645327.1 ceramidase [Truncatella angustata]KAH8203305.1 hypothetical protein TruAng_002501 [Truncatella angustata]
MGHHNRHFAGDRYALKGAWSPPTSSANFCEEDYVVTRYIAEFISSLTNFAYIYFAFRYMYGPGSQGLFAPNLDFMSISLFVLGICSFLFHASLRQTLQFADELGMLLLAWSLLQGILTRPRRTAQNRLVNTVLAIIFPLFSAFYIWTGKIIYHAVVYFMICVLITARGQYLFYFRKPEFPKDKLIDWRIRGRRQLASLVVAYILWNIDLEFCTELRAFREQIGLPWAWLFEFHGWWHLMTAYSASSFMDTVRELQREMKEEKED